MAKKKGKLPAGLRKYLASKRKAKKARKPAKRRTVANRKPAPRRATPRKMAKRKTKGARRRSTSRRSGKLMDAAMPIVLGAVGYIGAGVVAGMLPVSDNRIKGAALGVGGAFLATMGGNMAPVGIGMGMRGAVSLAQEFVPGITGIGNLPAQLPQMTSQEVDALTSMLLNGTENYQENLMGYGDGYDDVPVLDIDERGGALMGDDDGGDGDYYDDDNA